MSTTNGLSSKELSQIRADVASLMPDTCDILSISLSSDSAGGFTETWGTITGGTAVPCRLDFTTGNKYGAENLAAAVLLPFKYGIVSFAYDVPVTTANRLLIGAETYNVTGVNTNQSWIGTKRCNVERIP